MCIFKNTYTKLSKSFLGLDNPFHQQVLDSDSNLQTVGNTLLCLCYLQTERNPNKVFSPKTTGDKQRKEVKNSSVTSQKNAALHTPHSDPVTAHGISHINLWDSSMSRRIDSIVTLNCLDLGISTCRSR